MVPNKAPTDEVIGEVAGFPLTYRVETRMRGYDGDWADCGVLFQSPYGATLYARGQNALVQEYRVVDEYMPRSRRITPGKIKAHVTERSGPVLLSHHFEDEDYRVGPTFEVPLPREDDYGRIYD